jgi:DNA-binding Xre family transcriptional regulator
MYTVTAVYAEVAMEEKVTSLRCYSRLTNILSERKMTAADLGRALGRQGIRVNPKTLYRLTDPTTPIERLDMAVAGEICKALEIEISMLVSFESGRRNTGLQRLALTRQRRLDVLLERQAEGRLEAREDKELADLVREAELLTLRNARTLARSRHAASRT